MSGLKSTEPSARGWGSAAASVASSFRGAGIVRRRVIRRWLGHGHSREKNRLESNGFSIQHAAEL